jgi:dolichyl-phosphate-mannose-protein mannosyltransferase
VTATLEAPPADDVVEPEPTHPVPAALVPWHDPHPWHGRLTVLVLLIIAGFTRFWALGFPQTKVFDEAYYPVEAQEILRYGYEDNRGYLFIVHPPLGKWLIGFGEWMWDDNKSQYLTNTIGWRIMPAIFGSLTVIMVARIARRLTRSNVFGAIAGLLIAMDGMSLVLARTALLDVFLEFFVVAAFGAQVIDRDKMRARLGALIADGADLSSGAPSLGPRPWRVVAGVCWGLACSVKWTALSFFALFVLLSFFWDRAALRAAGVRRLGRQTARRSVLPGIASLIIAPIATYLFCNLGWFAGENSYGRHYADTTSTIGHIHLLSVKIPIWWGWLPGPIRSLGSDMYQAYVFHTGLDSGHAYASNPWSWLVLGRPVDFYYQGGAGTDCSAPCSKQILLIGTPLLWWAFIPMLLWLGWRWFTTRDWRAGAIWVAFAAGWLVWFHDLKRTKFLFYMAPLVPFLIFGLVLALGSILGPGFRQTGDPNRDWRARRRRTWGIAAIAVFLALVVADFAWMFPIYTGGPLTTAQWNAHMWLPSWI